jgi:hypothetical protein
MAAAVKPMAAAVKPMAAAVKPALAHAAHDLTEAITTQKRLIVGVPAAPSTR